MMTAPKFLLVDPAHFEVAYAINPWMRPELWAGDAEGFKARAERAFAELVGALRDLGAELEILEGARGAPDLVFPANAAVVLEGRAVLARFRHAERQVEEPIFQAAFDELRRLGVVGEVATLPEGVYQEGAGDLIWDVRRGLFWAGYGPRSTLGGARAAAAYFGADLIELELASERFYHLDTCFCPLSGGEILYYPPAFTPAAQSRIRAAVRPELLIEASDADAARFCVNAVCVGETVIMAKADPRLRERLADRGYRLVEIDLEPFILSGGGAYCMTLRLDRVRTPQPQDANAAAEIL